MIRSRQCPKCGNERIAGPHHLDNGSPHLRLDLPGFSTATLLAFTCAACGYTELYSDRLGLDNIRRVGRFLHPEELDISITCRRCGAALQAGSTMCYECGTPIE
ncbi:MAG: hypothetical protein AM326_02315 [Candidatus Thorarchaeota archaeon SMTZ-45]|nr:MAG: hypothetical protein AM326_02315 [Candidatus Thorarchaeota archaeon SMTZ-45]